ncbi:cation:proton antiporter [Schinkia azotoformans]|uniref:Sodium/hydrogen exchanger n=1 Tax=Schinkia azotoformans LMG 9581 TaxID=1131731 RepID=K6DRY1_SCHAZ|nr:cation:proton antiporter [Schinkia azotoformans]EKN71109.1 sodium/hydrogen exchanger [Schinkia azotoformans LMG 9581]MEC1640361.1 cation:proton antiporter [Schinkia azotoformans]MEC1722047.1 cation:proton antiporter [Schinkia azotoformans]MEC1947423.1 cation:proton antiporter [Schinkia azotoformans]MED4354186.1 cation:proton antiporter [Schinkia azotoformans]
MFSLTSAEISHFLLAMGCLLATAHLLGFLAERIFIPRVIGEVAAGLVLGPTLLGHFFPDAFQWLFLGFPTEDKLFGLLYQFGLLMLMFTSGLKFQTQFNKEDIKLTSGLVIGATIPAFIVGWFAADLFNIAPFIGSANNPLAMKIVIAISIAITSIPVISKIFNDLGIMHTRFAKIVVACAGIHDIFLWVALGFATTLASQSGVFTVSTAMSSLGTSIAFIVGTFLLGYFLFKRLTITKQNLLFRSSNLGYFLFIMFILASIAGNLHVETIFGALLAGIVAKVALPKTLSERVEQGVSNISFSWFIPIYFATVGLQLDLVRHFSLLFFIGYLLFATLTQTLAVYITSRIMKQDRFTSLNLGVAINDRGGPGIVLSSVAYTAGIINQEFFAILVMLALVTSWIPGTWLRIVVNKGWRLMPGDENLVLKYTNEEDKKWV